MNKVSIEMDIRTAAAIRQVLFDHQKGHSYEFPSERITDIRSVIINIDEQIEKNINQ